MTNSTEIEIVIKFNQQTGQVAVTGPITNKVLCAGMLEVAKEQILKYEPPSVAAPNPAQILAFQRKH